MVETPRLSSLAWELLKFFFLSTLILGTVIGGAFLFLGDVDPYYAFGTGFIIAGGWVLISMLWTKGKLEELLARLLYVIDLIEERNRETAVVPIPIHEEVLAIVESIKEMVKKFEERYEREIEDLEEQIELVSRNTAQILEALEKIEEGELRVEFPSGLDPVGAIGQALQHVWSKHLDRLSKLKLLLNDCSSELNKLALLLEGEESKIDVRELRERIGELLKIETKIREELSNLRGI